MRYIDADELMEKIKKCKFDITGCGIMYDAGGVQSAINTQRTADVVPKSEVEKLNNELMIWKQDRFNLYQRLELYKIARQNVAREIFEEIDTTIIAEIDLCNAVLVELECAEELYNRTKGEVLALCKIQDFIAELKKKYTEDKE